MKYCWFALSQLGNFGTQVASSTGLARFSTQDISLKLCHLLLQVGTGQAAYKAAVDVIKQWAHLQLGWNMTTTPSMKVGTTICSATQTVVPWSVLPARVTYMNEGAATFDGGKGEHQPFCAVPRWRCDYHCCGTNATELGMNCCFPQRQALFQFGMCSRKGHQPVVSVLPQQQRYCPCHRCCFPAGKRFSVGMCSLEGHQLAGEERFAVEMLPDGSVW